MHRTLWLWALLAATAFPVGAQRCSEPFSVGFRVVDFAEGRKAAVWYPASSGGALGAYGDDEGGVKGVYRQDAEPASCGRRPLVVFSHGMGGCGIQSLFLTEELARAGFVVIAPDHRDAVCTSDGAKKPDFKAAKESIFAPQKWTPASYEDRGRDIKAAIDYILRDRALRNRVDANRIALAGHSLGGYAALAVAGAWDSWRDDRVKAVLAMSPYIQPFQVKKTLGRVKVPAMLQGADLDLGITPALDGNNGAYATMTAPRYFVKLRGGSHFEWTNLVCFGDSTIQKCLETSRNARLIKDYAVAFLDRYVGDGRAPLLEKQERGLRFYRRSTAKE